MAILLVTYDLRAPGRNYDPVHTYLKQFTYCKGMESLWLIETSLSAPQVRDALMTVIDKNDRVFVLQLFKNNDWGSYGYGCADWLNSSDRKWA